MTGSEADRHLHPHPLLLLLLLHLCVEEEEEEGMFVAVVEEKEREDASGASAGRSLRPPQTPHPPLLQLAPTAVSTEAGRSAVGEEKEASPSSPLLCAPPPILARSFYAWVTCDVACIPNGTPRVEASDS